jgi:hypothetical protein
MLRYVEAAGEVQRAIAVLQTRGSAYDRAVRQVVIDADGMHIGEPLSQVGHVLPGGAFLPGSQQSPGQLALVSWQPAQPDSSSRVAWMGNIRSRPVMASILVM